MLPKLLLTHFKIPLILFGLFVMLGLFGCQSPPEQPTIAKLNTSPPIESPHFYRETATGLLFPQEILDMAVSNINDYEIEKPGLGKGISYRSTDNKLEFYVYDLGAAIIPNGIDNQAIQGAYRAAIADIKRTANTGLYKNFTIEDSKAIELGGHPFLHTRFGYSENLAAKESHLIISGFNTQIVKIRFTLSKKDFSIKDLSLSNNPFTSDRKQVLQQISDIVEDGNRRGFVGISNDALTDLQNRLSAVNLDDGITPEEAITIAQVELINKGYATKWNVMQHVDISLSAVSNYQLSFPIRDRESKLDTIQVWISENGDVTIEEKDLNTRF